MVYSVIGISGLSDVLVKSNVELIFWFFSDFDLLLNEQKYVDLEKIKTVGSTYMIASGLHVKFYLKTLFQ